MLRSTSYCTSVECTNFFWDSGIYISSKCDILIFIQRIRSNSTSQSCVLERNFITFSKILQLCCFWKQKQTKRAESRDCELHFGTDASSKLPIAFENGPMKDWISKSCFPKQRYVTLQRKCKGTVTYGTLYKECWRQRFFKSKVPSFIGPFSKTIASLELASVPK